MKGEEKKIYSGFNRVELEARIEQDKRENDWVIVSESILSNNPQWVMEVVYHQKEK